jgi:hypothetical protein
VQFEQVKKIKIFAVKEGVATLIKTLFTQKQQ